MKTHTFRLLSIIFFATLFSFVPAKAQKGENYMGVGLGYTGYNNGAYAKIDYQHSFSNLFRIAPEIGYAFRNDNLSAFECAIDLHMPVRVARGFKFYPIAGVCYNNWTRYYSSESDGESGMSAHKGREETASHGRIGIDLGGGIDIYMTSRLKVQFQGKYSLLGHYGGCFIDLGIGYLF